MVCSATSRASDVGYNYRMTDIQAAVGREQLKRLPSIVAERRALAAHYAELLADSAGLGLPAEPCWARSNWQSYAVRPPEGVNQQALMQAMLDDKISTRRGIMCSHRGPAYRGDATPHPLLNSESAQDRSVLLPLYAGMTADEQCRVATSLAVALGAKPLLEAAC